MPAVSAKANARWLRITKTSQGFDVTVRTTGLRVDRKYAANISVASGGGTMVTIPVALSISAAAGKAPVNQVPFSKVYYQVDLAPGQTATIARDLPPVGANRPGPMPRPWEQTTRWWR